MIEAVKKAIAHVEAYDEMPKVASGMILHETMRRVTIKKVIAAREAMRVWLEANGEKGVKP